MTFVSPFSRVSGARIFRRTGSGVAAPAEAEEGEAEEAAVPAVAFCEV